jgi:hypothetical protein
VLVGGNEWLKFRQRQPPAASDWMKSLKGECTAWPGVLCTASCGGPGLWMNE